MSDVPTDLSMVQPDGTPWTVVVWTYESGDDLSDDGALGEDEWLRYGGADPYEALLFAAIDVHGRLSEWEQACFRCKGFEWVCEKHPNKPWSGVAGHAGCEPGCVGPGVLCRLCALDADARYEEKTDE